MLGGAGHSQKLVQKFMISDKSTFPPVIYSARALPLPSLCRVCSLSFFSQCTRPFTAIVTTTPPGEKTKIQQRGQEKKKKSLAIPRWATH